MSCLYILPNSVILIKLWGLVSWLKVVKNQQTSCLRLTIKSNSIMRQTR